MLCSGKDSLILLVISLSASISVCVTRLETSPLDLNDLIFLDDKRINSAAWSEISNAVSRI